MNDDDLDPALRRKAAAFLDAEADAIDMRTRVALGDARAQAAQSRARQRLVWGGAGAALAAGIAVVALMPKAADAPQDGLAAVLAASDITLASEADIAIAEDLAFIAWLEENDGPS